MRATANAVTFLSARGAEAPAVVVAEQHEWHRGIDELPDEVFQVEVVARQDVAFAERIGPIAIGLEALVYVKVDGKPHVVQTARARTGRRGVDNPLEFDPATDATRDQRDLGWSRKRERPEVGDGDRLMQLKFATRTKDDA